MFGNRSEPLSQKNILERSMQKIRGESLTNIKKSSNDPAGLPFAETLKRFQKNDAAEDAAKEKRWKTALKASKDENGDEIDGKKPTKVFETPEKEMSPLRSRYRIRDEYLSEKAKEERRKRNHGNIDNDVKSEISLIHRTTPSKRTYAEIEEESTFAFKKDTFQPFERSFCPLRTLAEMRKKEKSVPPFNLQNDLLSKEAAKELQEENDEDKQTSQFALKKDTFQPFERSFNPLRTLAEMRKGGKSVPPFNFQNDLLSKEAAKELQEENDEDKQTSQFALKKDTFQPFERSFNPLRTLAEMRKKEKSVPPFNLQNDLLSKEAAKKLQEENDEDKQTSQFALKKDTFQPFERSFNPLRTLAEMRKGGKSVPPFNFQNDLLSKEAAKKLQEENDEDKQTSQFGRVKESSSTTAVEYDRRDREYKTPSATSHDYSFDSLRDQHRKPYERESTPIDVLVARIARSTTIYANFPRRKNSEDVESNWSYGTREQLPDDHDKDYNVVESDIFGEPEEFEANRKYIALPCIFRSDKSPVRETTKDGNKNNFPMASIGFGFPEDSSCESKGKEHSSHWNKSSAPASHSDGPTLEYVDSILASNTDNWPLDSRNYNTDSEETVDEEEDTSQITESPAKKTLEEPIVSSGSSKADKDVITLDSDSPESPKSLAPRRRRRKPLKITFVPISDKPSKKYKHCEPRYHYPDKHTYEPSPEPVPEEPEVITISDDDDTEIERKPLRSILKKPYQPCEEYLRNRDAKRTTLCTYLEDDGTVMGFHIGSKEPSFVIKKGTGKMII